jgi:hypothetical protein
LVKIFFLLFDSPYHLSMFQCGVEERRRRKKEKKMCLEVNLNFHFIQNLQLDDDIHPTIPTSRVTLKFNLIKFISRNVLYDWKEAINSLQRSTSELRVHRRIRNKKTWMNVQETTHNKQQLEYNSVDIDLIFILLNLKDYFLILFLFHSKYIICCCCCCTDIVLFFFVLKRSLIVEPTLHCEWEWLMFKWQIKWCLIFFFCCSQCQKP